MNKPNSNISACFLLSVITTFINICIDVRLRPNGALKNIEECDTLVETGEMGESHCRDELPVLVGKKMKVCLHISFLYFGKFILNKVVTVY